MEEEIVVEPGNCAVGLVWSMFPWSGLEKLLIIAGHTPAEERPRWGEVVPLATCPGGGGGDPTPIINKRGIKERERERLLSRPAAQTFGQHCQEVFLSGCTLDLATGQDPPQRTALLMGPLTLSQVWQQRRRWGTRG